MLAVADTFRDFWISKSGATAIKLDWQATWRNWVRNEKRGYFKGGKPSRPFAKQSGIAKDFSNSTYQGTPNDQFADIFQ